MFISFAFCPAALAKAGGDEWILVQDQRDAGQSVAYISHDAIRVTSKKSGMSVVAKAPDWDIHLFRPDEKKIWSCKLEQFNNTLLINPCSYEMSIHPHVPVVVRGTTPSKSKSSVHVVDITGTGEDCGLRWTQFSGVSGGERTFVVRTANDINVAPKAAEVICRLGATPEMDKIPLFFKSNSPASRTYAEEHSSGKKSPLVFGYENEHSNFRDLRSGPQIQFFTTSAKKVPLNTKDFDIPKDYKPARYIMEVTYSHKEQNAITDLSELGFAGGVKELQDKNGKQKKSTQ